MLGRAIARAFWVLYDNLFKGMLTNIILFALNLAVVIILWKRGLYVHIVVIAAVLWHVLVPAIMYYWQKIIRGEEHGGMFAEVFSGLKKFSLQGLAILVINGIAAAAIYVGMNFYRSHMDNKALVIIGGLAIWIIFCLILTQIYTIPILVMDEKKRIFTSYKKSLIMFLAAPFSSIGLAAVIAFLLALFRLIIALVAGPHASGVFVYVSLFPVFLIPFLSIMYIILLQLNAAILLFEKHNIYPDLKPVWEERSWSNLFKPWEVK
jgi:hypothetical protein